MYSRDVLTQPPLWLDEDITAALRRAMDMRRLGGAERLILGEAIRFMQQQRSDEQRSKWAMVLYEQPEEIPQPESSSSEPSPSEPGRNIIEEIMMKYGLEKINHPPMVIANPIPSLSEPTSAPPPSVVKYSESRKKAVARKHANKSTTSTASAVSEQEVPSVQAEIVPETQSSSQEQHAPPILKEVKLEIEDMTPEEFERYGFTDKISFGQMACLDAERARAKPTQAISKGKGKGKGKGKRKAQEVEEDPNFPVWNVKIRAVHYPNGEVTPFSDATGFPGFEEVENMKRAFEESVESERLRREREEEELQRIFAQIDQNEKDAHIAQLQKENEERQKERERKKRHQL